MANIVRQQGNLCEGNAQEDRIEEDDPRRIGDDGNGDPSRDRRQCDDGLDPVVAWLGGEQSCGGNAPLKLGIVGPGASSRCGPAWGCR